MWTQEPTSPPLYFVLARTLVLVLNLSRIINCVPSFVRVAADDAIPTQPN